MAKDTFYRSKPHVNVGAVMTNLMRAGISASGASQVANGQMPIDPADQLRMVSLLQELVGDGVYQHYFTVEMADSTSLSMNAAKDFTVDVANSPSR